jgi:hypothetical protein
MDIALYIKMNIAAVAAIFGGAGVALAIAIFGVKVVIQSLVFVIAAIFYSSDFIRG